MPIETKLINKDMMEGVEIEWLNAYHAKVRELVGPRVEGDAKKWLEEKTQPI